MCSLIVLRGFDAEYPVIAAANRDERVDRAASPPGLWVGQRRRVLSPRDRLAGGTWLAVGDGLRLAALTNLAGVPPVPGAPSRGHLPHVALDADSLDAGLDAVEAIVRSTPHAGFQLVVADAARIVVVRHQGGRCERREWAEPVLTCSNEHAPGTLSLRQLPPALERALPFAERLQRLESVLRDRGGEGAHAVLKRGEGYGTVSSSIVAVPAVDPLALVWRYAPGPPDEHAFRNYGNLGRRLLPEPG
jgi:hypothetical protein